MTIGQISESASMLSRRGFLVATSGASLVMAFGVTDGASARAQQDVSAGRFAPTLWWEMDAKGVTRIHVIKTEMGHHIGTAFARIVADELELDWADVRVIHVDSDPKWGMQETGGSTGVYQNFPRLSRAGAAGRIALIEAGAAMLGAPVGECRAQASKVFHGDRSIRYGQIVRGRALNRVFTASELAALPIKTPAERRFIGASGQEVDIKAKTDGSARFGIDASVPGMIYARPLPPPTRLGAKVKSVDDSAARQIPGYISYVVIDDPTELMPGWVTVAANTYPAAIKAAAALKVVWEPGPRGNIDEAALIAEADRLCADPAAGAFWVKDGDVDAALAGAAKTLESRYSTSTVLHFQLEPANALAVFEGGIWNIHTGAQWQSLMRPLLAKALGVEEPNVVLRQYYLGGGFGRRLWSDYAILAALTAKALDRPVKLVFTRADDTQLDCVRSPTVQTLKAGLDKDGQLVAIDHAAAAGWPSYAISRNVVREAIPGGGKLDRYAIMGADHWYTVPNHRVRAIRNELAHDTFVPGWLRSVGPGWVTWGTESFIDELAHNLGKDPAALRLSLLDGSGKNAGKPGVSVGGAKRLAVVVRRAMEKAGWGQPMPPDTALGLACSYGQERAMPTWTACVARVRVERSTGKIIVERLTHVLDCGTRIDPDGALAQAEGGTLWGLSMALHEGSRFEKGRVSTDNLGSYTPLRMADVPQLDIEFIDSAEFPSGMGEPPVIAIAPAIGNAVFAAVGVRLRHLPMRPEDVLRELKAEKPPAAEPSVADPRT